MKVYPTIVDNSSNLLALNEVIPDGLVIKEAGTNKFKMGNGISKWSQLQYHNQGPEPTYENDYAPKSYVDKMAQQAVPVGTIILVYGTEAPNGYFKCDSTEFNQNRNPQLFTLLGTDVTPDMTSLSPIDTAIYCIKHDYQSPE